LQIWSILSHVFLEGGEGLSMAIIRNILAATDFSANAAHAEARAAFVCRELGRENFHLLNVHAGAIDALLGFGWQQPEASLRDAQLHQALAKLEMAQERVRNCCAISCEVEARTGDVVSEILDFADDRRVDLITVGNSSRNCMEKLLGTTPFKLMRRASQPVLLARTAPARGYQSVLVPVDFSATSQEAARLALEIAPRAHITFLHVYSVWAEDKMKLADVDEQLISAYRGKYEAQARAALNQFIEKLGCGRRLVSRAVKAGLPVPEIASHAARMQPDLIVLGRQGGSRAEEYLLGNVAQRVINDTRCDVLVTPGIDPDGKDDDLRPAA
jgi:nucleotide-binding universal stress UspA family protein